MSKRLLSDSSDEYNSSDEESLQELESFNISIKNPETIEDLLVIAKEYKKFRKNNKKKDRSVFYLLSSIEDELQSISNMIGLKELKKSIVEQIIFFAQGLHGDELMHTVLYGHPGVGKCLAKDTLVIMYDGKLKKVQDVQVGDQLMGDDNEPRNVLSLATGEEMMYEIEQEEGDNYIVNKSHILTLLDENNIIVDIPLMEAINGKYKDIKIPLKFNEKPLLIEPFLVGLWLGFLPFDEFIVILEKDYNKEFFTFYNSIQRLNLHEGVPDYIKYNTKEIRLEFLNGFLSKNKVSNLKNVRCIDDIIFIARSTGNFIDVSGEYLKLKKFSSKPINIKKLKKDTYYGFVLDGNSRFLLGDTTVTHNTTMGRLLGNIYKKLGILSKGTFTMVKRSDFIGKYLGHTADKTQKLLNRCKGGVMFLDEAYSLGSKREDSDSFSKEAIDTLNQFLSENNNDFICIVAGYEKELNDCFFSKNPGLERRFPWKFHMDKYSEDELYDIFLYQIKNENWLYKENDHSGEKSEIIDMFKKHKELFSENGGDCKILFDKCKIAHAKRIFSEDVKVPFLLTKEDIIKGFTVFLIGKKKKKNSDISKYVIQNMYM